MLNIYERAPEDEQEEKNRIKIRPSVQKLARAKTEVYNVIVCNFETLNGHNFFHAYVPFLRKP